MKKFLALAAVMLGLASCQTEPEGFDVNVGGEQDVNITVSLPEGTRADSALGAFDHVDFTKYDVRFQCEVHYGGQVKVLPVQTSDNGKSATFPVRLIANRNYRFVVWADLVLEDSTADLHYITSTPDGLANISINDWAPMDETRDAFTCSEVREFKRDANINLELKRPFAKLRVITTDMEELMGVVPAEAEVVYTTEYRETFNAVDGKAGDAQGSIKTHNRFEIASYGETGTDKTLFTDYLFVGENDIVKFSMTVYDNDGVKIDEQKNFNTAIPVQRNYVTTIKGNILTYADDFNVEIKPEFDGYTNVSYPVVGSEYDLQAAINAADDGIETIITLDNNIEKIVVSKPVEVPATKVIVLDLNGKKIEAALAEGSTTNHVYAFHNYGELTIKGEGEIKARGNFNYGKMTLESGVIDACDCNGGYAVRNYDGAEFVMNGGSIVTSNEDGDIPGTGYDACPVRVDEGATATINGGAINNVSNYTCAIDNYGETTINGGTFTTIHTTIANHATMTINGGSFTCNGLEGVTAHAFWAAEGTATINGGTFNGKDNYNGFNVCASKDATVNIKGGEFLPVHSGSLYGEGTINVMGGFYYDDPTARLATGYLTIKINDTLYTVMKGSVENGVNTYVIENTFDFDEFSSIVIKGHTFRDQIVKLTEDVDFTGKTVNPVGFTGGTPKVFEGTFDGNGKTIKNIYQQNLSGSYNQPVGLFSKVNDATFKNINLESFSMATYGSEAGGIATWATGNCTFENIKVKNGSVVAYKCETGGVLGWAESGSFTFKDITIAEDVTIHCLWDDYGTPIGGLIGGVGNSKGYTMSVDIENVEIACKLDVYNDVGSNYQWGAYRAAGMIIGLIRETQDIGSTTYPNPAAENVTCKNVTVKYGDWMNYHYCEFKSNGHGSYDDEYTWKCTRVEASDWGSNGIDTDNCTHESFESHNICLPFDQLFGGSTNGTGRTPVYGLREFAGVTVNYPASYRREVSSAAQLSEALNKGLSVVLDKDIDFGSTQLAITGENQVVDLGGHALTTANNWGGISLKNGATIKNGTITHAGNTAAIKAFNGSSVENVTINATCTTADKTVTGIAVQQGANVESIKNVTINGVSQGIEVGYQATVGLIENAVVNESNNGTAKGIGLVINGGKVGLAKNCTFKGETYGITMHLKGVFAVGLELQNCVVEGTTAAIYAWDEKGISNTSGSLNLTYDAATTLNGELVWDFEDECKDVVTLHANRL